MLSSQLIKNNYELREILISWRKFLGKNTKMVNNLNYCLTCPCTEKERCNQLGPS